MNPLCFLLFLTFQNILFHDLLAQGRRGGQPTTCDQTRHRVGSGGQTKVSCLWWNGAYRYHLLCRDLEPPTHLCMCRKWHGRANPTVNTPRPASRGTRIESCDFIVVLIGNSMFVREIGNRFSDKG